VYVLRLQTSQQMDFEWLQCCYTLILDLKILVQTSFCFQSFQIHGVYFATLIVPQTRILLYYLQVYFIQSRSKCFLALQAIQKGLHDHCMFSYILFQFLHKITQKGILVISYKGTHFSPYNLSLSLFNLFA